MKATEVLVSEHKNILRILTVVKKLCIEVYNTKKVHYEGFFDAIDFIRNYADKFHHGKEEDILFDKMSAELGVEIKNGPIYGMLAEHDLGRLFIKNLEDALLRSKEGHDNAEIDIIANATCYTDLLHRHIDKEDTAIFTFAERSFDQKTKEIVDEAFEASKIRLNSDETEAKYVALLEKLEQYTQDIKF
ncbi:hemerythrin domain-containing protein [Serpentinicella sp. ANB-PHB4]|uniref:hemerythrin domain-containing protein n=1 Tax=Serpentinicella sp. ANB-PHB4 TaxID=3074076 RepID=UPI00285B09AC|nr:hemerythrin domain-containing protein [Serpentinicella sp. ANB-PHB4]MDR5659421.1 hemerythrin domain-containing protein [Serpentinicella sp. ANB-PHB4]